ncbi:Uncharacterised protein [Salmonella enterica subsp. enterica serovar Typhimurium]|nr:Uncharacterised protein [Salmonella enterica subsp. enterica serovar Typhimurium]
MKQYLIAPQFCRLILLAWVKTPPKRWLPVLMLYTLTSWIITMCRT